MATHILRLIVYDFPLQEDTPHLLHNNHSIRVGDLFDGMRKKQKFLFGRPLHYLSAKGFAATPPKRDLGALASVRL